NLLMKLSCTDTYNKDMNRVYELATKVSNMHESSTRPINYKIFTCEIAVLIYKITKGFTKDEIYGLTSQMRRPTVSVPSEIVEGCARESHIGYFRYLEIAFASLRELHYQFTLAGRLGYVEESEIY